MRVYAPQHHLFPAFYTLTMFYTHKNHGPYQQVFTVKDSQRGSLQTDTYILKRGLGGERKDNPGLLYHQTATEDL